MDRDETKRKGKPTFTVTSAPEAAQPRATLQLELALLEAFSQCQKQTLLWVGEASKDLAQLTKLQAEVTALLELAHLLLSWSQVCQKEVQRALAATQPTLPPVTSTPQGSTLPFLRHMGASSSLPHDEHPPSKSGHPLRSRIQEVMIPLLIEIVGLKCRLQQTKEDDSSKLTSMKTGLDQLTSWGRKFEEELKAHTLLLPKLANLSKGKIIERMKQILSLKTVS